ncbi:MAG: acyltransferase, partial [Candidatus Dormiibacterota bacterium]
MTRAVSLAPVGERKEQRVRGIDAGRALAALMVIGVHANFLVAPEAAGMGFALRTTLWTGVDIFFVISGYLIGGPFLVALRRGDPMPSAGYPMRRFARIMPAYWLALIAVALTVGAASLGTVPFVLHLLMAQDFVPGQQLTLYPVAWTLAVEVMFYTALPLTVMAVRRRWTQVGTRWLLAALSLVWAGSAALAAANPRLTDYWTTSLPGSLCLFSPGMAIA